jgi:hypothetical protein
MNMNVRLKELKKNNFHNLALKTLAIEQKLNKQLKYIGKLEASKDSLTAKLNQLEVAQLVFQTKLVAAIEEIEKRKFFKKLFGYRKLVNQLISTIRKGFKK